jgi:DNA-binding NarL/FixJ family response regulator
MPPKTMVDVATERAIRVLIVDDHEMFAESVARQLDAEHDLDIIARAGSVSSGVREAEKTLPDVAIVDYLLPDGDGAGATAKILAVSPDTRVLMVTGAVDERLVISAIDAGCSGFLTKCAATSELVSAVRTLAAGDAYLPSDLLGTVLARFGTTDRSLGADVTKREREVLVLLASGASTTSVADQLFVSVNTVRNHVQRILLKLGAHSKLEGVAIAVREGVIERPH